MQHVSISARPAPDILHRTRKTLVLHRARWSGSRRLRRAIGQGPQGQARARRAPQTRWHANSTPCASCLACAESQEQRARAYMHVYVERAAFRCAGAIYIHALLSVSLSPSPLDGIRICRGYLLYAGNVLYFRGAGRSLLCHGVTRVVFSRLGVFWNWQCFH